MAVDCELAFRFRIWGAGRRFWWWGESRAQQREAGGSVEEAEKETAWYWKRGRLEIEIYTDARVLEYSGESVSSISLTGLEGCPERAWLGLWECLGVTAYVFINRWLLLHFSYSWRFSPNINFNVRMIWFKAIYALSLWIQIQVHQRIRENKSQNHLTPGKKRTRAHKSLTARLVCQDGWQRHRLPCQKFLVCLLQKHKNQKSANAWLITLPLSERRAMNCC